MSGYPLSTQQLDGFRHVTDPSAEAVADRLFEHYGIERANELFRKILEYRYHDEIPGFFRDFMEEPGPLPDWIDPDKIRKGRQVFADYGREVILSLLCRSLPMCYICENGAHVLEATARLIDVPRNPNYTRRLLETLQFVINVCDNDILQPGGKGIITIRKIRLIHAAIRHFIHQNMLWPREFGDPINQEDQLITMSGFGLEVVKALARIGINLSGEEREGWCHLWFTTGLLLGIEEKLLPRDYEACDEMSARILASQARKSKPGLLLSRSCVDFMSGLLPHQLLYPFSYSVFKHLNDPQHREAMGFEDKHRFWDWFMPKLLRSTLAIDQKLEKRSIVFKFLIRLMNRMLIGGLSKIAMKNERYFYLPESLKS